MNANRMRMFGEKGESNLNDSKILNDLGRALLIILSIFSLIWLLVSSSLEAAITLLTAIAGIVASYQLFEGYRAWGRIALVLAIIVSLILVLTSPTWNTIATLLTSAIGAISSFGDKESWDLLPLIVGRETRPGTTSRIVLTLLAWGSWVLIWYVCLYWGFESYIPGLSIDVADMAVPAPQSWLLDNTMEFLIWVGLVGLVVVLPFDWRKVESVISASFWAGGVSIVTAWVSYLAYMAHGWNIYELFVSLVVIIVAHILLIGFIVSIGMALFGIGVAIVWTGFMMLVRWIAMMAQRLFALDVA
jgi:hypothetical protein